MPANTLTIALIALVAISLHVSAQPDDDFERERAEMLDRQRRVILNNDGGDAVVKAKEPTAEAMLQARTVGLEDTHVDTIFYCTNRGTFARHSHRSELSQSFLRTDGRYENNVIPALLEQGTDPLEVMVEWCRDHDVEVFWSERMNDRHDAGRPRGVSEWKREHPECLMSTKDDPPPHGAWSQVDYSHEPVRDQMFAMIEEVCRNYNVDGIEMDFFRHPCYFKTVAWGGHATDEETAIMTRFVRRVREMTERVGRERGRPILVAIRVPDSVPLARAMGLDLQAWLSEGLVDMMTGSGYFRMNPWTYLAELGHEHGVKVYAGLSDSRIKADRSVFDRRSQDSYRGRAARAWQAGVDGIYLFNMFNPDMRFLHQIGDLELLTTLDRTWFATVRNRKGRSYNGPDYWIADGSQWLNLPVLTPEDPISLAAGTGETIPFHVGAGVETAGEEGAQPRLACHVAAARGDRLRVRLNGRELTERTAEGRWVHLPLPGGLLQPGENSFELSALQAPEGDEERWDVEWTADALPAMPWQPGRTRGDVLIAELQDDALLVADRGTEAGDYIYFRYPWNALPDEPAEVEAEVKVISGWNNLTVSNGARMERVTLYPDHIGTHYTNLRCDVDTTDEFHTYRVVVQGDDIRVYMDGELRIDGEGQFTYEVDGRNNVAFGAANSPSEGEALWRAIRINTPGTMGTQVYDLVVTAEFPDDE